MMAGHRWLIVGLFFPVAVTPAALDGAGRLRAQEASADAAPSAEDGPPDWTVILGAMVNYGPDYEGSDDYEVSAVPVLVIQYQDLGFFRGDRFGLNLLRLSGPLGSDKITAGPLARFVFPRDEDNNDALEGLGDVDFSLEVGGFVSYELGPWSSQLSIRQDVAGGHEGLIVSLEGARKIELSPRFALEFGAAANWADGTYMASYFGVDDEQAADSGLDEFDADAGLKDIGASLKLDTKLTERWTFANTVTASRLLGDAADSPIVDDEGSPNQYQFSSMLSYRF